MTQKITRFNLNEIKKIRVKCLKCQTTIEIDTTLDDKVVHSPCPRCKTDLFAEKEACSIMLNIDNLFKLTREVKGITVEMEFEEN